MNQSTNQTNPEMEQNVKPISNKKNYTPFLLALLVLSLVGNIYLFFSRKNIEEHNQFLITENTDVNAAKDTLQYQYDAALARLDMLTGKNAELDEMVRDKDGELQKLKKEIKSLLTKKNATISDLKRAQSLIGTLKGKVRSYEDRIAELETENTELTASNKQLTIANDSVSTEANKLKELGSVLHISNVRMEPINLKRNGTKEVGTSRAKRVDILRVVFDIDENRIVENGLNEVYVLIQDAEGNLLSNAAYGSGVTSDAEGNPLNYTVVRKVNLEKGQRMTNVSVDWKQDSDYKKGTYYISFYNRGYKVGNGTVDLR